MPKMHQNTFYPKPPSHNGRATSEESGEWEGGERRGLLIRGGRKGEGAY